MTPLYTLDFGGRWRLASGRSGASTRADQERCSKARERAGVGDQDGSLAIAFATRAETNKMLST